MEKFKKEDCMITGIPFEGFYETISCERVREALGYSDYDYDVWSDDNPKKEGETKEQYDQRKEDHFNKIIADADYHGMQNEYASAYVDAFAKDNELKLEFEKLESPRYYNFTTDRIFAFIPKDEVKRLVSIVNRKLLADMVKEKFTSRDGFSSFYSNDLEEWNIDQYLGLDHNQLETIIECVTGPHIQEENERYPYIASLMENFYR